MKTPRFGIGSVVLATALAAASTASLAAADAAESAEEARQGAVPYGVAPLLEELRLRQARVERREQELADREQHLAELDRIVEARLAEIERIAETVESRIAQWEESSGDTIRRLAKIYAAMPPDEAARLVEELDVELATQIVAKMKHKESAAVLSRVSRERALAMSRNVAHPLGMEPAAPPAARAR